uniref:Retrotransposon Copia-like N-terminal domain-containing protein n=1 Tax=Gossypium raimondii TaxID=29730 RepID=A0A0D2TY70_GOSRA|nr:hypothetical protein B456_013G092800 [Gossypium raimondii]
MAVTVVNSDNTTPSANIVIQFNPVSQLPTKLIGSQNYSTWKAQVSMLMHGHNIFGPLDGSLSAPPLMITTDKHNVINPAYQKWFQQDQLVQNALLASVKPTLASTVANAPIAHKAWLALQTAFANKSQTRLITLQDNLARLIKDTRPVADYLHDIRTIANELATAGEPLTDVQLTVRILQGLGLEYTAISAAIRSRSTPISYEELYEKLLDHELFLQNEERKKPPTIVAAVAQNNSNQRPSTTRNQNWRSTSKNNAQWHQQRNSTTSSYDKPRCQLCERIGYTAKVCRSQSHNHHQARANYAGYTTQSEQT